MDTNQPLGFLADGSIWLQLIKLVWFPPLRLGLGTEDEASTST